MADYRLGVRSIPAVCLLALTAGYFFLMLCALCSRGDTMRRLALHPIFQSDNPANNFHQLSTIDRETHGAVFPFFLSGSFLSFIPFHLLFFPPIRLSSSSFFELSFSLFRCLKKNIFLPSSFSTHHHNTMPFTK